ncbi:hemagglutinin repeat-containing protein, partial [Billgrantia sp. Q4P2]|uniref:hemagglutinin repeat-containing protein n=1 Tax=Billgrantia sp. Q4P2 TaxID=3463857 RepID=UPI00405612C5
RYGRVTLKTAELDHQATLSAGQDLILNAGRDLGLAAVDVSVGGNGLIAAGRDLALETLATGSALRGNPRLQRSRRQEVGTTLAFGNDLTLLAGQDIHARAADVSAEGDLGVIAGRDIAIEAGQSRRYDEQRRGRTHTIDSRRRVQGSDFNAGGDLTLNAGDDLRLTASRLQAGNEASLLAGGDIELLTAQQHDYSLYEKKSSGGLLGGSRTQRDEVSKTRAIGSQVTSGGDLLIASGLDQTYRAARLEADGDIELQSGGSIRFETASDVHSESHERSKSSFAWQSSSGEGFTRETLRQSELVAQGELIIQAADGLRIDVQEIDRRSVTRTIDAMVAANPDLAWLQEMEQRGDVDWRRVKAFHDSWDYEQSGLGAGAALVVAIVASATGQYYALAALEGVVAGAAAA